MATIKIKRHQFSGLSKVYSREPDGLAAILRGLAIDSARLKVEVSGVKQFTDNSTGAGGASIVALPIPSAAIDATSAGGAQTTALNTSLGKIANAGKVIANTINEASSLLGLPASSAATGAQAAADTIPAQDKTNAATSGNTSANFGSTVAALSVAANDLYMLAEGVNEVLVAVGATPIALPNVSRAYGTTLVTIPTVVADTDGSTAAAQADVQGFLVAAAEAIATIAAAWNAVTQSDAVPLHVIAG